MHHSHTTGVQGGGGGFMPSQIRGGPWTLCGGNFPGNPRNVVVWRALQARWSLALGRALDHAYHKSRCKMYYIWPRGHAP